MLRIVHLMFSGRRVQTGVDEKIMPVALRNKPPKRLEDNNFVAFTLGIGRQGLWPNPR